MVAITDFTVPIMALWPAQLDSAEDNTSLFNVTTHYSKYFRSKCAPQTLIFCNIAWFEACD